MTVRTLLVPLLALFTASCSLITTKDQKSQSHHAVSKVRVNVSITIPSGKTRVFFQGGKIVSQFDHYHPNCNIEVRLRDDNNIQSIQPSTFQVVSIKETLEEVVNLNLLQNMQLAQLNLSQNHSSITFFDSDPADIYRGYHFYLSGEDSNVYRLSCRGAYAAPSAAMLPTFHEMKHSLGDVISFQ